jgi:hypothetical protein
MSLKIENSRHVAKRVQSVWTFVHTHDSDRPLKPNRKNRRNYTRFLLCACVIRITNIVSDVNKRTLIFTTV